MKQQHLKRHSEGRSLLTNWSRHTDRDICRDVRSVTLA